MEKHNLDINMYSFKELLDLFDLDYDMTLDDLKRAKKKLVHIHPDKSNLPNEYFRFYKEAFDTILHHCKEITKQKQEVGYDKKNYEPTNYLNEENKKKVRTEIGNMSPEEFRIKFNKLFNENMFVEKDNSKYEWFSKDESHINIEQNVNQGNMGQVFENIKNQQQDLVRYKGVQEMNHNGGNNLYEDDDEYACSDPFSKLKFDDLRKVHKDETIFAVKESDINKKNIHNSVESLQRERGVGLTPMQKDNAERMLRENQQRYRNNIIEKQHTSNLQTNQYQEKNKKVLAQFLKLTN